jgi:hypothetical protein
MEMGMGNGDDERSALGMATVGIKTSAGHGFSSLFLTFFSCFSRPSRSSGSLMHGVVIQVSLLFY